MGSDGRNAEILEAIINDTEYDNPPQSRNEEILLSILNDTEYDKPPKSRIEGLLLELKEKIEHGGGGGGGANVDILAINQITNTTEAHVKVEEV